MSTVVINLSPQELHDMIELAVERVIERRFPKRQHLMVDETFPHSDEGDKLANLVYRPDAIKGDPDDLIHIKWAFNVGLP